MSLARRPAFRRVLVALGVSVLATLVGAIGDPAAASPGPSATGQPATAASRDASGALLLSLGDSLGFGYQGQRVSSELAAGTYSPQHFPGYTVPFARQLAQVIGYQPRVVNYACPGETTSSMIAGPCAFADEVHAAGYPQALHNDFTGSQLTAAARLLQARRGRVSAITLSIGANDLNNLFLSCQQDVSCVQENLPGTLATLTGNLGTILATLREQAPQAQILVLTPYNPAYVINPSTDALLTAANSAISAVAKDAQAVVADGFAAINLAIPDQEQASVCTYTLMCSQSDIHPSDAGYLRLAEALWKASGYGRLVGSVRAA
jgi:lysophospholipase L1-like esterase